MSFSRKAKPARLRVNGGARGVGQWEARGLNLSPWYSVFVQYCAGMTPSPELLVLFLDMDAFFASVEQMDHPGLGGGPSA